MNFATFVKIMQPQHIIISRTDSIGDVILTLPMAGMIKKHYPDCKITFLGRTYTKPIVAMSEHVDGFLNYDDFGGDGVKILTDANADTIIHVFPVQEIARMAKSAGIPNRVGTVRKIFHLGLVNRKLNFTRRKSDLHEAQLNMKMLTPLGIDEIPMLDELPDYYGFTHVPELTENVKSVLEANKINLILHPKSKGSAMEWGLENFRKLLEIIPQDLFNVMVTGTEEEGKLIKQKIELVNCRDLTGKFTLEELIALIGSADGLLAASTGPLHIAAALGKHAFGIFSERKPIHPGRWSPVGKHVHVISHPDKSGSDQELDQWVKLITPEMVLSSILEAFEINP